MRRTTLPLVGSAVYELTERGRELEPALMGLARWGLGLLDEPRPGDAFRPVWTVQAMKATFRPEAARWARETYEFHFGVDGFHLPVDDGVSEPEYDPAFEPDLVVRTDPHTLLSLVSGWLEPTEAIEIGRHDVEGDLDTLARVGEIFSLPPA